MAEESRCTHCGLPVPANRRAGEGGVHFCCFGCHFAYELARPGSGSGDSVRQTLLLRLGVGIFCAMNVMLFSYLFYSQEFFGQPVLANSGGGGGGGGEIVHGQWGSLIAYLVMFLATVVVATLGVPILADAWGNTFRAGEHGKLPGKTPGKLPGRLPGRLPGVDANLLIMIGVFSAYVLSAVNTLRGRGSLYFDTASMILVLVTLGHYLDSLAKLRATSSANDLLAMLPESVNVWRDGQWRQVASGSVVVGERVRVRPGEVLPVDGEVREGVGHVDESSLTGESVPRAVGVGEVVLAGSHSLDGELIVATQRAGEGRVIEQARQLLIHARSRRAQIQTLADRVATLFVPGVVLLAIAVFGYHALHAHTVRGLFDALSVLLISCPCALGLAAPLATWNTLHRAAQKGVLIDSPLTLERSAALKSVYFDKTGTLTQPRPVLNRVDPVIDEARAIRIAATLETSSTHPIAAALGDAARAHSLTLDQPHNAMVIPGLGITATVEGQTYWLGGEKLVTQRGLDAKTLMPDNPDPGMRIYLMDEARLLARFVLGEKLRPESAPAVRALQQIHLKVGVLSGDAPAHVRVICASLNIEGWGGLLPGDKVEHVRQSERNGPAAFVGDGINDAPVLAAASVGFAVSSASELARSAGHVRLLTDRLDRVPTTIAMARHCVRRIRFNLLWAFGYNTLGITLAVLGWMNPIFAASAMFVSSAVIVWSSSGAGRLDDGHESPNTAPLTKPFTTETQRHGERP